jgi:hypothetical protein
MTELLTREQILEVQDIQTEPVECPEWGGKVLVQGLTSSDRDAFEGDLIQQKKGKDFDVNLRNLRAKLVARCVVNEKGERLFTDKDAALLGKKSAVAMDRVFSKAQKLSGISTEDVEELAKNLSPLLSANVG